MSFSKALVFFGPGSVEDPLKSGASSGQRALHFSFRQFFVQLPLQLLLPWSLPLYALLFSPAAAPTVLACPNPPGCLVTPFMGLFFFFIQCCPSVTFSAFFMTEHSSSPGLRSTLSVDLIHTLCAFLCTRFAVCIKYGIMTPHEYHKRMHTWVSTQDNFDSQLITGWLRLTPLTIHREMRVLLAGHSDLADVAFLLVPAALRQLRAGLCSEAYGIIHAGLLLPPLQLDAAGTATAAPETLPAQKLALPAHVLATALILQANHATHRFTNVGVRFLFLLALFGTFSSTAVRAYLRLPILGSNAAEATVIIGHWLANAFVMGAVFSFMFLGAVDHRRHALSLSALGKFVTPTVDIMLEGPVEPLLPLSTSAHVKAFMLTRTLLRSFGSTQQARLVALAVFFLLIFFFVAAYVLVVLYQAAPGALEELLPAFVLLHTLVMPALVVMGIKLSEASRVNLEAERHVLVVCNERLRLRLVGERSGGEPSLAGLQHLELLGTLFLLFASQGISLFALKCARFAKKKLLFFPMSLPMQPTPLQDRVYGSDLLLHAAAFGSGCSARFAPSLRWLRLS